MRDLPLHHRDPFDRLLTAQAPRRARFYQEAPKMAEVVRRVDQDPRLARLWAKRLH